VRILAIMYVVVRAEIARGCRSIELKAENACIGRSVWDNDAFASNFGRGLMRDLDGLPVRRYQTVRGTNGLISFSVELGTGC
jgi:hypothetical protein